MIFNKVVFLHIPKTAGSSIRSSLKENFELECDDTQENLFKKNIDVFQKFENKNFLINSFNGHLPLQILKKFEEYKDKPVVTFVRNPFSRIVSNYFECLRDTNHTKILGLNSKTTFEDFLDIVKQKDYWFTMPMIDWIGKQNLKEIDFIGKIENFEEDVYLMNKKLNINIKPKHHNHNNSIGTKYSPPNYINFFKKKKTIDIVNNLYKDDLEIFNYDFDSFKNFENKKINKVNILKKIFKKKILA